MIKAKEKNMRTARIKMGFSLHRLSLLSGICVSSLSSIEKGTQSPFPSTAQAICQLLDSSFDDLFVIMEEAGS